MNTQHIDGGYADLHKVSWGLFEIVIAWQFTSPIVLFLVLLKISTGIRIRTHVAASLAYETSRFLAVCGARRMDMPRHACN